MLEALQRHPHAAAVLGAALRPGGRASHAYLFHGPAGSGKAGAARAFAAELLAEGSTDPDGARTRVAHGVHPDLTWVAPASSAGILVADIDEPVVVAATRTPFEAARRVFVIEGADELNDPAANRMLKTLEEPPAYAHLILLSSRPGEVMPTIASRCQPVRFDAPPLRELAGRLQGQGVAPEQALACAGLGLGDADRALSLAVGEGPALRAGAEALARAAVSGNLARSPWDEVIAQARARGERAKAEVEAIGAQESEMVPRKERRKVEREAGERAKRAHRRAQTAGLDHALQLTGLWFRDLACVADGLPELVLHTDRADALAADAQGRSAHRLRAAQQQVDDARAALEINPGEELLLEALAIRLAQTLG